MVALNCIFNLKILSRAILENNVAKVQIAGIHVSLNKASFLGWQSPVHLTLWECRIQAKGKGLGSEHTGQALTLNHRFLEKYFAVYFYITSQG